MLDTESGVMTGFLGNNLFKTWTRLPNKLMIFCVGGNQKAIMSQTEDKDVYPLHFNERFWSKTDKELICKPADTVV